MEEDLNKKWEETKRRFHSEQARRRRFKNVWRRIKPLIQELIIYSFIALIFFVGYYVFDSNTSASNDTENNQLESQIRSVICVFLLCVSGLFTFHIIFSMVEELIVKKLLYLNFKRIRLLKAQAKHSQPNNVVKNDVAGKDKAENGDSRKRIES